MDSPGAVWGRPVLGGGLGLWPCPAFLLLSVYAPLGPALRRTGRQEECLAAVLAFAEAQGRIPVILGRDLTDSLQLPSYTQGKGWIERQALPRMRVLQATFRWPGKHHFRFRFRATPVPAPAESLSGVSGPPASTFEGWDIKVRRSLAGPAAHPLLCLPVRIASRCSDGGLVWAHALRPKRRIFSCRAAWRHFGSYRDAVVLAEPALKALPGELWRVSLPCWSMSTECRSSVLQSIIV